MNALDRFVLAAAYRVPRYGARLRQLLGNAPDRSFPPGHFYSPVPSRDDVAKYGPRIFDREVVEIPGIDLAIDAQLALVDELAAFHAEQPFSDRPEEGRRYGFRNDYFEWSDVLFLYGLLRKLRPKRLIEIGSGHSSAATLDINDRFFDGSIELTFVEPFCESLRQRLRPDDADRVRIVERPLQEVSLDFFDVLEPNDILFLDSSHVVKAGSDCQYFFAEILPRVRPGVYIHVHDIGWPFEYPRDWVDRGVHWNEAYVLRSFLQFNQSFRIVAWIDYLRHRHAERLFAALPLCANPGGSSFWMQRVA